MKASANPYPFVTVVEGTTPANPSAGDQLIYIDSADHKVKRVNSTGTVTTVEGAGSTPDMVRCYAGTGTSLTSAAFTAIAFDTNDTNYTSNSAMHSTVTNTTRLIAQTTGRYAIIGVVLFGQSSAGTAREALIRVNGSTYIAQTVIGAGSNISHALPVTTEYYLTATDYVEIMAYQDSGSTQTSGTGQLGCTGILRKIA